MRDEPLQVLAAELAGLGAGDLVLKTGLADGFGMVGASILDVTHEGSTVRVWNERSGDFWFEFGDQLQAAWWKQDGKGSLPTKVILALVEGAYEVRNGRVTVSVDDKPMDLRESI
jgi:hypothetical protein